MVPIVCPSALKTEQRATQTAQPLGQSGVRHGFCAYTLCGENRCARADGAFLIIRAQGQRMGRIRRSIWMDRISVQYSYSLGETII